MVGACFVRLLGNQDTTLEVALASALPWIALPSAPIVVISVRQRKKALAAVCGVVIVLAGVWEGPVMWPVSNAPRAASGTRIRVYDANLAQDNFRPAEIAAEIRRYRPNVVALEELTPPAARFLRSSGVLAGYSWSLVKTRYGPSGMGVWSNLPMAGLRAWVNPPFQVEIEGSLDLPGSPPIQFDALHVYAPVGSGQPATWRRQLAAIRSHLAAQPRPIVAVGDFNATSDNRPLQLILGLGLRDAAVMAGRGWEMTWPRNQAFVIPYLRIDHVLLSAGLTTTAYRLGVGVGSDHHPLIVEIAPTGPIRRSG
jgi:endonuclease/exonuclease/phosphatase (EEP) superfamily protein YafD